MVIFNERIAITDKYQHRRHNKNLLMVHLIFVTKYRKKLFSGSFTEDIKQYLYETCVRHHWYIKRMETDKDHIHILLQYNPTDSVTAIVSILKQYSTYCAWKHHPNLLKHHYWKKRTLWSDGYFAASIGQVSQQTIEHYIENQG
jgi:putative transposase